MTPLSAREPRTEACNCLGQTSNALDGWCNDCTHRGHFPYLCSMPASDAPLGAREHEHQYVPNGVVREAAISYSPVTAADHTQYDKAFSIGLCACGAISKVHVANENVRTQADDWRRERDRA